MEVKGYIVEKVSQKTGKPYIAIEFKLTDTITKLAFLSQAEYELYKLYLQKFNNSSK